MLWESTASSTHVHFKGHKPVVVPDVSIDKKLVEQLMDAYAVENAGSCDLITMLLKSGADLELPNDYGDTALLTAVKLDNLEAVEVLVRWGADINATNYHGETSLHLARDDRLLYFLLDNSCDNETINCINECGCSPCLAAVQYCKVETLVRMIQAGADIHFKNEVHGWYSCLNYGRTPLSIAVAKNRVDIVEALLKNGANPKETWSVTDENDEIHIKSTLKLASSFRSSFALNRMLVSDEDEKSANILQLLINHGANICDDIRSFHAVMRYGNLRAIQFCLNEFHHKRVPIPTSTPLLHLALENKRDDVFKFFLQSNFDDLEKVDRKGYTALHVAVFESRIDRVGLLLSYGASVEAVDKKGYTVIDTATNYKDVESAILLLNYGYLPHRRIDMTNLNIKPFCRLLQFSLYETEMKLIVKHTTLIESLAYPTAPDILSWVIKQYPKHLQKLYKCCKTEIELSRRYIVHDSITMFDILTNIDHHYARNESLVEKFMGVNLQRQFPIYKKLIRKRFSDSQALLKKVVRGLGRILQMDYQTFYHIYDKIFYIVSPRDLHMLQKV
ncbi:hypothetical protein QAD02_016128 [Eretmocerus hayati]|uniref:Uncharacterized protein n=1 Tax=Eretmocerus hayati TaxID=131215 RepID=A0ACC2PBH8_9HYME|nr:hypothetical protein QAD02_016128 [Eretmocerus hayati]